MNGGSGSHVLATQLEQSAPVLQALLAHSADMITVSDRSGQIIYASPATERVSGYTVAEFVARHPFESIHPDDRAACRAALERLAATPGLSMELQHRILHRDGGWRWVEVTFASLFHDPAINGLVATVRDISARKAAEDALRASEERYRTLFASIDEGFCLLEILLDDQGVPVDYRFVEVNPAFEQMTGLSDAVGKTARELVPDLEAFWVDVYGRVALTGETLRFEQGSAAMGRAFDVYASRFGQPGSLLVALVFSDITERKRAEQALRESENRFRNMADNAPVIVWLTEADGRCTFLSRSWYTFTGQQPEQGLDFGWLDAVHPDDRDRNATALLAASAQHSPFYAEYRLRRHDGVYCWVLDTAQPRFDADGGFFGYIGSVLDLTERKQVEAERERLFAVEQAARSEAEAALQVRDQFLSIAAHELRTPLTALLGYATLLQRLVGRSSANERMARSADRVVEQAQRMDLMIEHLLDVSRLQRGQFEVALEPFELGAHLERVVDVFRMSLPPEEHARPVALLRPPAAIPLRGDVPRLEEVFANLLSNAVKYSPGGQPVEVRVGLQERTAVVEVVDHGIGIPAEALAHLFMPFYRAPNVGARTRGFGVGLYVVRQIVERHGGQIEVESAEGVGSVFRVILPLG